jgi:hypothetical protein
MQTANDFQLDKESFEAVRAKLAQEMLSYIQAVSGGEVRKAIWIMSSALNAKLLRPNGDYIGRFWYSAHDKLVFVKPAAGMPYRQRDFCCTAKFLFLLAERLQLKTVEELFFAAIKL